MTGYLCRIAKLRSDNTWDYRVLDVEGIGYSSNDSDRVFHPLVLRSISTILHVGGETGHLNAQRFPTIVADFGQVDEKLPIDILHAGEGDSEKDKFVENMTFFSNLREWLQEARLVSTNKLYLQMFVTNAAEDDFPQVALDPLRIPMGNIPGHGWRGVPSNLQLHKVKPGDGEIHMTFTWQFGVVIPV